MRTDLPTGDVTLLFTDITRQRFRLRGADLDALTAPALP